VQPCPACVTVTDSPAIVRLPLRCDVLLFSPTLKLTVPLPSPEAPPVIVIHDVGVDAVQSQPSAAVTPNVELPPADGIDRLCGETVNEQAGVPNVNVFD
jgi:hypothetical protein